jgi:PIN domain nuclease of toxin-antitoxin system
MKLLLDTHVYLWWLLEDRRLIRKVRHAISGRRTTVHVSAVNVWEATIKAGLGRLALQGQDLTAEIVANGFVELPVSAQHAQAVGQLPRHHRDPFDRLLIAQAHYEGLTMVTHDPAFAAYGIAVLWT